MILMFFLRHLHSLYLPCPQRHGREGYRRPRTHCRNLVSHPSPLRRQPSPLRRHHSPLRRQSSSLRRHHSPLRRQPSSLGHNPSPLRRHPSSLGHHPSHFRRHHAHPPPNQVDTGAQREGCPFRLPESVRASGAAGAAIMHGFSW